MNYDLVITIVSVLGSVGVFSMSKIIGYTKQTVILENKVDSNTKEIEKLYKNLEVLEEKISEHLIRLEDKLDRLLLDKHA